MIEKAAAAPEPVGVVMEVNTLPVVGVYGDPAKSFSSPSAKEKRAMWFRDLPIGTQLYTHPPAERVAMLESLLRETISTTHSDDLEERIRAALGEGK